MIRSSKAAVRGVKVNVEIEQHNVHIKNEMTKEYKLALEISILGFLYQHATVLLICFMRIISDLRRLLPCAA